MWQRFYASLSLGAASAVHGLRRKATEENDAVPCVQKGIFAFGQFARTFTRSHGRAEACERFPVSPVREEFLRVVVAKVSAYFGIKISNSILTEPFSAFTFGRIRAKSRFRAISATKHFHQTGRCGSIDEATPAKNRTNVKRWEFPLLLIFKTNNYFRFLLNSVANNFRPKKRWIVTCEFIRAYDRTNAHCATRASFRPPNCVPTCFSTTTRMDSIVKFVRAHSAVKSVWTHTLKICIPIGNRVRSNAKWTTNVICVTSNFPTKKI